MRSITSEINSKEIIIATNNPHKQEKLRWIVEDLFDETLNIPEPINIDESGKTFEENARIKALEASLKFGKLAIATDGGVLIPALGYDWNELLTKRFAGEENKITDWDRIDSLLDLMKNKKGDDRLIEWKEAIAIANPEGVLFSAEVEGDRGLLQKEYKRDQYREGIWVCTLWSYPQFGGKNFFELEGDEIKEGEISWWRLKEKVREFFKRKHLD